MEFRNEGLTFSCQKFVSYLVETDWVIEYSKMDSDEKFCKNLFVIYWPSTEPSIKRCTCINKWKNSRSRWSWDYNITRCPGQFESVGDKMPMLELAADRGLWALSDPQLSNPAQMRMKYCWVNIAVCSHLQLISHTQPTSPFQE